MAKSLSKTLTVSDARVDAMIAEASSLLRPILLYLRELVHEAVPEATETVKWGMPFFELEGTILANMGIFKAHCSFGFWSRSMTEHLAEDGLARMNGAGSLGKVTRMEDLPPRRQMLDYLRTAAEHIRTGLAESPVAARKRKRGPDGAASSKLPIPVPDAFAEALAQAPEAKRVFEAFPPSCRREYLSWITEAKRDETRARRVQQAVSQLAQGKRFNWQYEAKP